MNPEEHDVCLRKVIAPLLTTLEMLSKFQVD